MARVAWRWCVALLVAACGARAQDQVVVVHTRLPFDETHAVTVNATVEYILQFVPSESEASEAGEWLSELQVSVDHGDLARPLLLTVRRTFGATTWQLPYTSDDASLQRALTRTLCPDDAAPLAPAGDCEGSQEVAGSVSLHLSTWCTRNTLVTVTVRRQRGWLLGLGRPATVTAEYGVAAVRGYRFADAEGSVRLTVESPDAVCATLAVQEYGCALPQSVQELQRADTVRMTVLHSAGLQLQRSRYPRGFFVIVAVHATDAECLPDSDVPDREWLWEAAVLGERDAPSAAPAPRRKTLRLTPQAALSRGGYVLAGGRAPFGLPARLHVAALARRRERVLAARSDRYFSTLGTVGLFYALPVVQFVAAFQIVLNVSGSLDLCYYNFLCAHPAGAVSDFNHVFSNVGYLLLGALFMLQEYGIPAHYGLLSALGAAMMMVALLSATYHICPNGQNFQFDTAFMYVLAVLCMVKVYQARHPDINARAHATFGVLAVLIALVVWGVLGGGPLFWSAFTVLHVFTFLLLSLRIYYLGQFRFEKGHLAEAARGLRSRPLYLARLVMLLIANAVNWAFALYGLFQQSSDFAGHVLSVLLCNVLMQMLFYMTMKLLHGERPRWYTWVFVAGAGAAWAPALYWFTSGSSDWSSTPALSRGRNHECRVLQFYDAHDLWHLLSAVALYFSFNVLLTWDDGLAAVRRDQIAVF